MSKTIFEYLRILCQMCNIPKQIIFNSKKKYKTEAEQCSRCNRRGTEEYGGGLVRRDVGYTKKVNKMNIFLSNKCLCISKTNLRQDTRRQMDIVRRGRL